MGRGSAARKSDEQAQTKKKPATWSFKPSESQNLSVHAELVILQKMVEGRVNQMDLKAKDQVDVLKNYLMLALVRLPSNVQKMKVRDYVKTYGGRLDTFADMDSRREGDRIDKRTMALKLVSASNMLRTQKKNTALSGASASSFNDINGSTALPVCSTPASSAASVRMGSSVLSVKTKRTPGGGSVPYVESSVDGVDSESLQTINSLLAEFRKPTLDQGNHQFDCDN